MVPLLQRFRLITYLGFLSLLHAGLHAGAVRADDLGAAQIHFRTGLTSMFTSGALSGTVSPGVNIDLEYEGYNNLRSSMFIRANFGYDQALALLPYSYIGFGKRFYFWSLGKVLDATDGKDRVSATPKLRYFVGGEVGASQLTVRTLGAVLEAKSGNLEVGPHLGAIYQVASRFGIEAYAGGSYAFGFTSIAVNFIQYRLLIGGCYSF